MLDEDQIDNEDAMPTANVRWDAENGSILHPPSWRTVLEV